MHRKLDLKLPFVDYYKNGQQNNYVVGEHYCRSVMDPDVVSNLKEFWYKNFFRFYYGNCTPTPKDLHPWLIYAKNISRFGIQEHNSNHHIQELVEYVSTLSIRLVQLRLMFYQKSELRYSILFSSQEWLKQIVLVSLDVDLSLATYLRNSVTLQQLILRKCCLLPDFIGALNDAFRKNLSLKLLEIFDCNTSEPLSIQDISQSRSLEIVFIERVDCKAITRDSGTPWPNLCALALHCVEIRLPILIPNIRNHKKLRYLNLAFNIFIEADYDALKEALSMNRSILHLKFEGIVKHRCSKSMLESLINNESIRYAEFNFLSFTSIELKSLNKALSHNNRLEKLYFDTAANTVVPDLLRHNRCLRFLEINLNNNCSIKDLIISLQYNYTLTHLTLFFVDVKTETTAILSDSLRHNHSLEVLKLSCSIITAEDVYTIMQALMYNSSLKHIIIECYHQQKGVLDMRGTFSPLMHNYTLNTLILKYFSLSEVLAQELAEVLCHNQSLVKLEIELADYLEIVASSLMYNSTLKLLSKFDHLAQGEVCFQFLEYNSTIRKIAGGIKISREKPVLKPKLYHRALQVYITTHNDWPSRDIIPGEVWLDLDRAAQELNPYAFMNTSIDA